MHSDEKAGVRHLPRDEKIKKRKIVPAAWEGQDEGAVSEDGNDEPSTENSEEEEEEEDYDEEEDFGRPASQKRKRTTKPIGRNRATIATTVTAMILFAHSRKANAFQTLIGLYTFISKTTKRAQFVFNHMGVTVSPITIGKSLVYNADTAALETRSRIRAGAKIGFMYDNLVIYQQKGEETEDNKNESLQLTACAGYFLRMPNQSAQEINSQPDRALTMCASMEEVEDEYFLEPGSGFVDIDEYEDKSSTIGIPNKHLFRDNPQYNKLTPNDILNMNSIDSYYPDMVKGHLNNVLRKYAGKDMRLNPDKTLAGYQAGLAYLPF